MTVDRTAALYWAADELSAALFGGGLIGGPGGPGAGVGDGGSGRGVYLWNKMRPGGGCKRGRGGGSTARHRLKTKAVRPEKGE